jgi:diphthamide synthase (EF-2-diphthine--ammonia ligase)
MQIHLSWSGGKDSAMCYARLRQLYPQAHIQLHCAMNQALGRVSMHGVPLSLIEAQAHAMGVSLQFISVAPAADNSAYEQAMCAFYRKIQAEGFAQVAFGDLHLEDLKAYRLSLCQKAGIQALFPLWQMPYTLLSQFFEETGIRTVVCAANLDKLPIHAVGKDYHPTDYARRFPEVDIFGEKGEFHTFVYDAAFFKATLPVVCRGIKQQSYEYKLADGSTHKHAFAFADLALDN